MVVCVNMLKLKKKPSYTGILAYVNTATINFSFANLVLLVRSHCTLSINASTSDHHFDSTVIIFAAIGKPHFYA